MRLLLAPSLAKGSQYEALSLQLAKIVDTHYIGLSWPVTQLQISRAKKTTTKNKQTNKKKLSMLHISYALSVGLLATSTLQLPYHAKNNKPTFLPTVQL